MNKKNDSREGVRVKMVIYDSVKVGVEEPIVWSDEPLFFSTDEITSQAMRLLDAYENKVYGEGEMQFLKREDAGSADELDG